MKKLKEYLWPITLVVGVLLWLFQTFVTASAMAEKERALRSYVDEKHTSVEHRLDDLKNVLDRVDQRVYEINKKVH